MSKKTRKKQGNPEFNDFGYIMRAIIGYSLKNKQKIKASAAVTNSNVASETFDTHHLTRFFFWREKNIVKLSLLRRLVIRSETLLGLLCRG